MWVIVMEIYLKGLDFMGAFNVDSVGFVIIGGILISVGFHLCLTGWCLKFTRRTFDHSVNYTVFILGGFWFSLGCVMIIVGLILATIEARQSEHHGGHDTDIRYLGEIGIHIPPITAKEQAKIGVENENGDNGSEIPEQKLTEELE
jgi:hypothetical protein